MNHEDIDTYYVTVSVYDGKASDGSTEDTPVVDTDIDVTIEVEDVNEKPTFDATPPVEYQIAENTAVGYTQSDAGPHRHRPRQWRYRSQ